MSDHKFSIGSQVYLVREHFSTELIHCQLCGHLSTIAGPHSSEYYCPECGRVVMARYWTQDKLPIYTADETAYTIQEIRVVSATSTITHMDRKSQQTKMFVSYQLDGANFWVKEKDLFVSKKLAERECRDRGMAFWEKIYGDSAKTGEKSLDKNFWDFLV